MNKRRMLVINDLIWFFIGPLLFLAGIYINSWFFMALIGLFVGLGFCMRGIHSTALRQDHPVAPARRRMRFSFAPPRLR